MKYGLIGESLAHSHSQTLHALLADYDYRLYPLAPDALAAFVRQPGIGGLNVTIPYKRRVMALCDALSDEAARIGSVNTLVYDGGRITGHNTDYAGLEAMLRGAGISLHGRKVVILGSGGTGHTAQAVARDAGAREVVTISRQGPVRYQDLPRHADADILINATPVGMHPDMDAMPAQLDGFTRLRGVADVICNPLRTRLVLDAMQRGIAAAGGLPMLVGQAAEAAALFTGRPLAPGRAEGALKALRRQVENIVLVGMPGGGKSVIGAALASLSGRTLIDTDEAIVLRAGMPIPAFFDQNGEAAFRALEREIIANAARQTGVVIATGGGSVLDGQSCIRLRQTGRVFHVRRPLEALTTRGRPLSGGDLRAMAARRMPLYRAASDEAIDNVGTIEAAAQAVWEAFNR